MSHLDAETRPSLDEAHDVFMSYASADRDKVLPIVQKLHDVGVSVWRDEDCIPGGTVYGGEIVRAIRTARVLILACSEASMRSMNVQQEISHAWHFGRPYIPVLLEGTVAKEYPDQVSYWLLGHQWIDMRGGIGTAEFARLLLALSNAGIKTRRAQEVATDETAGVVVQPARALKNLRKFAAFTDCIWPVLVTHQSPRPQRRGLRGLGEAQSDVARGFRIGDRVRIRIESQKTGYLTLLDEGPEGIIFCLCPSYFAPDVRIEPGQFDLPQRGRPPNDAFRITGTPGREELLAIFSDEPLALHWAETCTERDPAHKLTPQDENHLMGLLAQLGARRWHALSTYFDIQ